MKVFAFKEKECQLQKKQSLEEWLNLIKFRIIGDFTSQYFIDSEEQVFFPVFLPFEKRVFCMKNFGSEIISVGLEFQSESPLNTGKYKEQKLGRKLEQSSFLCN